MYLQGELNGYYYNEEDKAQLKKLEDYIQENEDKLYDLHSYDEMVERAKEWIDEGNLFVASHILSGMTAYEAEYYNYDFGMGSVGEIKGIDSVEALKDAYPELEEVQEVECR